MSSINDNPNSKKFKFKMPHVYVTLVIILLAASAMSYIIPAGSYDRYENSTGQEVADPDSFHYVEQKPTPFWYLPVHIVDTMGNAGKTIMPLLFIGGALQVISATGMFHAFCSKLTRAFSGKEKFFIPGFMLVFSIIGITQGPGQFVAFAQLGAMIALSLGYDAIVGVSLILLAMNVGMSTGIVEPGTAIAQQIAGLPVYSGVWLRIVCFIIFYIVTTAYVMRYAEKVKNDKTKSYLYGEKNILEFNSESLNIEINKKHYMVLAVFVISFVILLYGSVKFSWGLNMMGAIFVYMAVAAGLLYGFSPSVIAEHFGDGLKGMVPNAFMVGLGTAIGGVLTSSGVLDTVVNTFSIGLRYLPSLFLAPALFVVNSIINFFIISGVGQAAVVMPIITPLCDVIGVSRQVGVLAYKLGSGFSDCIYPSSSTLLIFLASTGVPYSKWIRYFGKLLIIDSIIGMAILVFAQIINYV